MISLPALRSEIDNDPKSLGYAALLDQPQAIADRLNLIGASDETITKEAVDTADVVAAIVRAEHDALSAASREYLHGVLLAAPEVKVGEPNVRSSLAGLFPAGTSSRANLIALATRPATRGEVLFGLNAHVTAVNVAHALGRP